MGVYEGVWEFINLLGCDLFSSFLHHIRRVSFSYFSGPQKVTSLS